MSTKSVYQIKVTLLDSYPPIWRKFLVADTTALSQLHTILQIIMGWTNSHLHQFIVVCPSYLYTVSNRNGTRNL